MKAVRPAPPAPVANLWDEIHDRSGLPRPLYEPLLGRITGLPRREVRLIQERLEATMREMGVTFDIDRRQPWGKRPWFCDILPHLFAAAEWEQIEAGLAQRVRAFELFLQDVYGAKEILHEGVIPVQPVLGSPSYQRAASGLPRPGGAFLHLSGASLARLPDGRMAVTHHYFSNASGISYMMQNRRALSRVFAEGFHDHAARSIAGTPTAILEALRSLAGAGREDPVVVLLTPGPGSAAYSEHSFLARRMGIPLVQGGDLLVLDDRLYLKSVSGLDRIDVVYTRLSDNWLDPLVFDRESLLGVPGLVHCVRQGSVALANAVGSQLADDRSLLRFAPQIIRYYLGEAPVLPGLETWWLGDIDQCEHVLDSLEDFDIRPLYGERFVFHAASPAEEMDKVRALVRAAPQNFTAQPRVAGAETVCFERDGRLAVRRQDHIVFALRGAGQGIAVFPGALTRVSREEFGFTASELGGGSKDSWVLAGEGGGGEPGDRGVAGPVRITSERRAPEPYVTSRVADSFYWLGRYLERAHNLAYMIGVVESLETEELNRAERQLYRPVWTRMLPPLEKAEAGQRRSLTTAVDRYRLALDGRQEGSVLTTLRRALWNAGAVQECLSVEAFGVLNNLQSRFEGEKFQPRRDEALLSLGTQRLCGLATAGIAEFFGTAEATMLADGGWRFCRTGQYFERASVTANAGLTIVRALVRRAERRTTEAEHALEIELSAFLRMLGARDAYRRIHQMRAEPVPVLEVLYQHAEMPRSVCRCLRACERLLLESHDDQAPGVRRTLAALHAAIGRVQAADWTRYFDREDNAASMEAGGGVLLQPVPLRELEAELTAIWSEVLDIHQVLSDGFINHQVLLD